MKQYFGKRKSNDKMDEDETFEKLRRKHTFDELMHLITGKDSHEDFYQWTIKDIATFSHVTPKPEFWQQYGEGWTWEEFREACKKRKVQ